MTEATYPQLQQTLRALERIWELGEAATPVG
jgi:hypothetical protein